MKQQVSLSLSEEILEKIDLERGLAARSAYVEAVLRKFFKEEPGEEISNLKVGKAFPLKEDRSDAYVFR